MRKITREIVNAFQNSRSLTIGNSRTNGESLWLFGNKIAEIRRDGLWITNAGWDSVTTKERLNGLSGVHIQQRRGVWLLNDRVWDGRWVNVDAWNDGITYVNDDSPREEIEQEREFDTTSEWIEEFGYSEPVYSVFHTLVESQLESVEQRLEGIPSRRMESDTEGVYQPNYFIIVHPEDVDKAVRILSESYCLA
jgi:hypothetical protein